MINWTEKIYVIVPIGDVTEDMVGECLQTSIDDLRLNVTETHAILKWYSRDDDPATISALDPAPTQYTNFEIKAIIDDPENGWIEEIE